MSEHAPPKRRPTAKPLADIISQTLSPALAAKGFAGREVVSLWPELVGARLGARSRPLRIDWPKRRPGEGEAPETATLVVLVESAFAPELQHAGPMLMGRINAHLGWPAIGRLALRQGPVRGDEAETPALARALTEEARQQVERASARIEGEALRQAVQRLGQAVSRRSGPSG